MEEKIIFANENDEQIGAGSREEAWSKGLYVRIVRAILRDEKGRILSQHRSPTKKSYANCWTDSASGHVDDGESYDFSMNRELKEELGIETPLRFVGKFPTIDKIGENTICEFNAIYEGTIDSSTRLELEEGEVTEAKWFEIDEIKSLIAKDPTNFTPGFREAIRLYY